MEKKSALLALCDWNPSAPRKGQWRRVLMRFLNAPEQIVEQTNKTSVIWEADRAHYDATVLKYVPIRSHIVWLFI